MKRNISTIILILFIVQFSFAQHVIRGKVLDAETNLALTGASVIIKGSSSGTITDANGDFTIEAPAEIVQLHFSHLGYESITLTVSENELKVALKPETTRLDEVVVTATKTERLATEVPAKVSVIRSSNIENSTAVFADEALKTTSGVYLRRSKFSDVVSTVTMRGFEGKARTLVLLDGQALNDGYNHGLVWSAIPTDNIEKIEVIRGPFSCLYGGNAMGGVINVITKIPEKETINFRTSYGTYKTITTHLGYSNKLTENIGIYVSWDKKYSEGFPTNFVVKTARADTGNVVVSGWQKTKTSTGSDTYIIGDVGDNYWNQDQYFGKLVWDISPKTNLSFSCNISLHGYGYKNPECYLTDSAGMPVNNESVTIIDNGMYNRISVSPYSFIKGPSEGFQSIYKLNFATSIQNVRLTTGVGFSNYRQWYISSASGANEDGGPGKINKTSPNRAYSFSIQADIPLKKHLLTLGTDYRLNDAASEEWNLSDWQDEDSETEISTSMNGKQEIMAGYAQLELNLVKNLKVYAGARFDHWKNYEGESSDVTEDTLIIYEEFTNYYTSPKIGLVYSPKLKAGSWELISIRVSGGNAFRPPTLYNMYKTWYYYGTTYESNPDLEPEITKSWEIGIEQSFFNRKTKISTDYYESYVQNLIYNNQVEDNHKRYENAGKGEIKGLEAEIRQYFTSWLDGFVNLTYQSTEIIENEADSVSVGKEFTNVPGLVYNMGLLVHTGSLKVNLSYHFSEKTYSKSDNSDTEESVYSGYDEIKLLDGKISYAINENMNISLNVNNILDKDYYVYYKAPGRTYTINFAAKF